MLGERLFSSALRVSSAGVQLWTHYDVMDNVLCNVVGRKRILLWPPAQVGDGSALILPWQPVLDKAFAYPL